MEAKDVMVGDLVQVKSCKRFIENLTQSERERYKKLGIPLAVAAKFEVRPDTNFPIPTSDCHGYQIACLCGIECPKFNEAYELGVRDDVVEISATLHNEEAGEWKVKVTFLDRGDVQSLDIFTLGQLRMFLAICGLDNIVEQFKS